MCNSNKSKNSIAYPVTIMSCHCLTILLTQDLVNYLTECICTGFALYSSRRGQRYYEVACHLIDSHAVEKRRLVESWREDIKSMFSRVWYRVSGFPGMPESPNKN